jgi:hypothetical protein
MNSKNEIANLEAIEKALKRPPKYESGLSSWYSKFLLAIFFVFS